jgi:hypothetical protein
MTEKQLIGKIKDLRQIKPSQNWVSFTKSQILGEDERKSFVPFWNYGFSNFRLKFAMASILTIMIMLGSYGIVERSLPGDLLYIARRVVHKAQTVLLPDQEKPAYQLKLANDRLNDLANAPAKNLAPTISELQANISEAARDLARIDATTSDPIIMKKIVDAARKLNENKQKAESLGMVIGEKETIELNKAFRPWADYLIKDLESRTLSEQKTTVLNQMKELYQEGEYDEVVIYFNNNQ